MSIEKRLKIAREELRLTQKEIAEKIGTSQQTWQVYESGKSTPGGKVLEGLAVLGVNINWLLTGYGRIVVDRWQNKYALGIGDRIKEIRGKTTIEDFSFKFYLYKGELEKYEDEKEPPDVNFLADLCNNMDINPSWLLIGSGPKKLPSDFEYNNTGVVPTIDVKHLKEILVCIKEVQIELLREGLIEEESFLNIEDFAELISFMYEEEMKYETKHDETGVRKVMVKRLFRIAKDLKTSKK